MNLNGRLSRLEKQVGPVVNNPPAMPPGVAEAQRRAKIRAKVIIADMLGKPLPDCDPRIMDVEDGWRDMALIRTWRDEHPEPESPDGIDYRGRLVEMVMRIARNRRLGVARDELKQPVKPD